MLDARLALLQPAFRGPEARYPHAAQEVILAQTPAADDSG